ncbi:MAG: rhodanese-like domain-containing protein [Chlamydiae bacterium]|nr:rhodanese-like domain-containing protein [Chlamydiota bacterium]
MLISTIMAEELPKKNVLIIDVREKEEYTEDHIPHSLLCPLSTFHPKNLEPLEGNTFVFYCKSGKRSQHVAEIWTAYWGKSCYNLEGGILAWNRHHS